MAKKDDNRIRINEGIRAREVRVIDVTEGNLGVMSIENALKKAQEKGLDLIEITPDIDPPIVKIMDYGKYQYEFKKKDRVVRSKARDSRVEVKEVQIKIGTGDGDLKIKGEKAGEWINEGNRVKIELFLKGRTKGMEKAFLHERLKRLLNFVTIPYTIVEQPMDGPKGPIMIIEKKREAK